MRLVRQKPSVVLGIYAGYAVVLVFFLLPVMWVVSLSFRPLEELFQTTPPLWRSDRQPLPALYLGGDVGQMSCIANDFAWDEVFSRPLQALATEGDLLFCLSTSGNSSNVVSVLEAARHLGIESIALLGRSGGIVASLAERALVVGSDDTARIQEAHLFLIHWFCDYVEEAFPTN